MIKIKVRYETENYRCGDGCCDYDNETAYVTMDNGEEFEVDVTGSYYVMHTAILAKLGYEIEEE